MKLKKIMLLSCSFFFSISLNAADWVDDYFSNSVTTSPSSFENQKRGFYSLGSFQGRINTSTDPLFSVNLPKASGGCKGLDLFMGSFSMLDEEFLVQKLENAMQAAPAIAFDMALKTLTKEFSETLAKFEQITNMLNGIQVNDCAIAEGAVQAVLPVEWGGQPMEQVLGKATSQFKLDSSAEKNSHAAKEVVKANNDYPDDDMSSMIDGCASELVDLFGQPGSLLSKATSSFGMSEYENLVRGYIGDVMILIPDTTKLPTPEPMGACDQNKSYSLDDFVQGLSYAKDTSGTCSLYLSSGVNEIITNKMISVAGKIESRTAFSAQDNDFINSTPLPVYSILRDGVINGALDEAINSSADLISYSYANSMFSELHRNTSNMVKKVKRVLANKSSENGNECNLEIFTSMHAPLEDMEKTLRDATQAMRQNYINKLIEVETLSDFVDRRREVNEREFKKQSQKTLGLPEG